MLNKINNKINNKIIVSSIGIFLIYKFYKHMVNIEYINSLSNKYYYNYIVNNNTKINKENLSSKNEPFVIVDYSIETDEQDDIPEVNYINAGNYLHELGK